MNTPTPHTIPKCCIVFIFVLMIAVPRAISQKQVSFRQLSVKEGLSQNSAISIAQDSTGFLWIATQDGLNKFDGKKFEFYPFYFKDITSPTSSQLGKVYIDRENRVWILPNSQIPHILNKETNQFDSFPELSDVSTIFQDSAFNLWFGTYSNGLFKMDRNFKEISRVLKAEETGPVYTIKEDHFNNVWLGCRSKLLRIDPNLKTTNLFPDANPNSSTNYSCIVFDRNNQQWVGTFGEGLWYREADKNTFKRPDIFLQDINEMLHSVYAISMLLDHNNQLWVGTYGEGLFKIDLNLNQLDQYLPKKHNPRAIHYKDILSIFEDYSGTLWFGTDGAGVSYYDEYLEKFNSVTNFQTPESINIDVVRAITTDVKGNVWIGTSGKGLSRYAPRNDSWQTFLAAEKPNSLSSNRIMSLLSDTDGDLWIGTQEGGLNILDPEGNIKKYNPNTKIKLPANTIWCMLDDEDGNKWLGTREEGLLKFDKERGVLSHFKKEGGAIKLPSNNIRALTLGAPFILWVATEEDGIARLDLRSNEIKWFQSIPGEANSLVSNNIKSLFYDPKGILWIGTNGSGLCAYDTNRDQFYHYTTADGLSNNVIYGILPDENKNLWLSSNKGISKFSIPPNLNDPVLITNYTNYDGLATEFNTGAYYKARNGDLYFGGLDGYYWFTPSDVGVNPILPKTEITGLDIFNGPQPLIPNASFKASQNTLTFQFASLQFSLPAKNQYQYKLEGHDPDWISSGNMNSVRYTNLLPGSYRFLVKSSNYDGLWNASAASYPFTILNPWYATSTAYFIYAMLVLLLLYFTYAYFKWRWYIQLKLKLKEEEAQRLKHLDAYKTRVYTNISHEFRTPLTLISAPIKRQLQNNETPTNLLNDLRLIDRNASQLLGLVDELLELSKLESGIVRLKVQKGEIDLMLRAVAACFAPLAEQQKIIFKYKVAEIKEAWYDPEVINKIVNNLLANAIKYCPEKGDVSFKAFRSNTMELRLEFTNTIKLSSVKDIDALFARFYQTDTSSEGFGIGLSLVKELIKLNRGHITAKLLNDTTIQFIVILPATKEAFAAGDINEAILPIENRSSENNPKEPREDGFRDKKPMVLIVDDHKDLRTFIRSLLLDKFNVLEAGNGKEGVKVALREIPDLIITDIMMPITNGIELSALLKQDERTSHIPIIMLTAKTGEANEIEGLHTGVDDYIVKPFHPEKLVVKVERLITLRRKLQKRYQQDVILRPKDIAITPIDEKFLNRAQEIMDRELMNPAFNAAHFSKVMGMSRMQLHRKLIALTGLSTSAFIRSQRLKAAMNLLQHSDATIAEITYSTGFNTPSYFIKCFKEAYGKTPTEYSTR